MHSRLVSYDRMDQCISAGVTRRVSVHQDILNRFLLNPFLLIFNCSDILNI